MQAHDTHCRTWAIQIFAFSELLYLKDVSLALCIHRGVIQQQLEMDTADLSDRPWPSKKSNVFTLLLTPNFESNCFWIAAEKEFNEWSISMQVRIVQVLQLQHKHMQECTDQCKYTSSLKRSQRYQVHVHAEPFRCTLLKPLKESLFVKRRDHLSASFNFSLPFPVVLHLRVSIASHSVIDPVCLAQSEDLSRPCSFLLVPMIYYSSNL